jgi:hypothetical protein
VSNAADICILHGHSVFGKWHVDIDDDIVDEIRDMCSGRLQLIGFDENYGLTRDGEILEELVDLFYVSN